MSSKKPLPDTGPLGCILYGILLVLAIAFVACLHAAWFAFRMEMWKWMTGE